LTDELAIGLDYATLHRVFWRLEQGMDAESIATEVGLLPAQVQYVQPLTERARYLLLPPRTMH
jgi:hypothetical protein